MTRAIFIAVLVLAMWPSAASAQGRLVTVDLASDHVDITTGFNGTHVQVFGVRHDEGELAIIVKGPMRTMSVRRKESVLGAWINRSFETFKHVPSYYNYALSAPVNEIAQPKTLRLHGIGPENLQFNKPQSRDKKRVEFREALIRNKQAQGLYVREPGQIHFMGADFFRADFYIPSNVPVGEYEVHAISFVNGAVRDVEIKKLRVAQVGIAANFHKFAYNNSLLYGAACVFLAIFAGWFSNRVRRG